MSRGRPPKSAREKELSGNPGKRPIPKTIEPKGVLVPPKTLTPEARLIWKEVVCLMAPGVYAATDQFILECFCQEVAVYHEATHVLKHDGYVATGSTGQPVTSPWRKIQLEAIQNIHKLGARLHLDPVARQSIVGGAVEDDGFGIE